MPNVHHCTPVACTPALELAQPQGHVLTLPELPLELLERVCQHLSIRDR